MLKADENQTLRPRASNPQPLAPCCPRPILPRILPQPLLHLRITRYGTKIRVWTRDLLIAIGLALVIIVFLYQP